MIQVAFSNEQREALFTRVTLTFAPLPSGWQSLGASDVDPLSTASTRVFDDAGQGAGSGALPKIDRSFVPKIYVVLTS